MVPCTSHNVPLSEIWGMKFTQGKILFKRKVRYVHTTNTTKLHLRGTLCEMQIRPTDTNAMLAMFFYFRPLHVLSSSKVFLSRGEGVISGVAKQMKYLYFGDTKKKDISFTLLRFILKVKIPPHGLPRGRFFTSREGVVLGLVITQDQKRPFVF